MTVYNVGSGQTYATPEAAIAAVPATLTANADIVLNDITEYVYTASSVNNLDISGHTLGGFAISMIPAAGKAFKDNFVYGTDAIKYNAAKGVAFKSTGAYAVLLSINQDGTIIRDLQLKIAGAERALSVNSSASGEVSRIIIDSNASGSGKLPLFLYGANLTAQNILLFQSATGDSGILGGGGSGSPLFRFITVIRDSGVAASGTGFSQSYNGTLKNCVEYNHSTVQAGFTAAGNTNNATNQASGYSNAGNVYNLTGAAWTNITAASLDLTVPAGSVLAGAGVAIGGITTDLLGRTRANPPTIGALEVASGGGGGGGLPFFMQSDIKSGYIGSKSGGFN